MAVYGSKTYGTFKYGVVSFTDISVYPFTAQSLDYGSIKLTWSYPLYSGSFSTFVIVRNPLGFPVVPDNGDLIYKSNKVALSTAGGGSTVSLTSVSSSGTKFTAASTAGLKVGQSLSITAGTGVLATSDITVITQINDATTFNVNLLPGTALSGASVTATNSLLGATGTLTDVGGFYDPISGSFTTTYSGTASSDVLNSNTINLKAINSNIKVGQVVSYAPSGALTGANAGSGVIGGTTVTAVTTDTTNTYTIVTLSDYANIPKDTVLTFSPTGLSLGKTYYYSAFVFNNNAWNRVGTALGTSIKNYKTADSLYEFLPEIYKATLPSSSSVSANKNIDLYNFLRVFGVQHDLIKTKIENAKNRYDTANLDGRLIPTLMNQMGFIYESGMGLQQSRRLLKNASTIYLNKGTGTGLKQFVSSFSGYGATLGTLKNLFLTLDCSSFETSDGFWGNVGSYSTIAQTTSALEGGSPAPVSISTSPSGYPNSQLGYVKLTSLVSSGGPYSTYEFTYGVSQDTYNISTTSASPATNYNYVTLFTDTEHSLKPGQYALISGMYPPYINGTQKVLSTPDSRSFTFYSSSNTASTALRPYGASVINTQTPTGTTNITITTAANHYIVPGQSVVVSNVIPTQYNGTWVAQAGTQNSTLIIPIGSNPGAITAAGTTFVSAGTVNLFDPRICGIPVTARSTYFFSIYTQAKTTGRSITTGIRWYDQYGIYLDNNTGTNTNNTSSWTRVSSTFSSQAPDSAAYAVPYVSISTINSNEVHYFDCAQFELVGGSTVTNYADSRRVDVYLTAPRINNVINPGFETATTAWSTTGTSAFALETGASNVYPTSAVGLGTSVSAGSAKLTANATTTTLTPSSTIPVSAGKPYAFSAYVKGSNADSIVVSVVWKNTGGTTLQTDTSASLTLPTSSFSRLSLTPVSSSTTQMIAPATATTATITLTFTGSNGRIYYVDSVMLESTYTVNNYFDGGTGYNVLDDLVWEQNAAGTTGTSVTGRSLYYPNKNFVQSRLATVLPDYLPTGTNYALFIGTTAT